ncbi:MAG: response regulator [Cyclobacteriaceae bacterium]|nr:response regulator [Cyclobacteriaceae bacterium]
MESALITKKTMNVLLIGNNPSELSTIYEQIKKSRNVSYIAEVAFDISDIEKFVKKSKMDCIVIDDKMEKKELDNLFQYLKKNSLTSNIPITIVQNSNADDAPRGGADEFILKNSVTSETLTHALFNSLKIHELRNYLKKAYTKRKRTILAFR